MLFDTPCIGLFSRTFQMRCRIQIRENYLPSLSYALYLWCNYSKYNYNEDEFG